MNITVITLVGFAVTIFSIYLVGYLNRPKPDYVFSFEDTMGIHKVPVVSFEHDGQIVNFIIDSGASHSILNISSIDTFDGELLENAGGKVYGIDGNSVNTRLAKVEITKNGHAFQDVFQILAVPGIDKMNAQNGVEVHGILGSTFLKRYQFVINYKYLKAYTNG
jgi:hypothetical protein